MNGDKKIENEKTENLENYEFEKENKKGNFKTDFNIGIENQIFGITLNGGYDAKGKNVRGGIGLRAIY